MAGYIRQSTFVDGDTITAALFNNEYNQLVNAFSNTSGHKHDGTTAEGPVIGLIGDAGETSPNNKVLIDTTNNYIEFYVEVSSAPVQQLYIADGAIIPVTDSDIDLGTTSLRFKDTYTDTVTTTGNVSIGGDLTVTGSATISGNLTFGDADTDSINLAAEIDSDIIPNTDGTYDLGSATKEWQDLYIDGTANIDSLVADTADINGGTIDGATIATSDITVGAGKTLNVSAGTLTLADNQISGDKVEGGTIAATTITTLTSTTGNITNVNATTLDTTNLEVTNLKAKDGTAAGSIADSTGVVTLGSSVLTTTDINGGTIDGVTIGGTTAGAVTFTDLSDGTITIAGFADEDNMSSNSATLLPTQQSVKAYVDSQVTAQDLDFQGDTGGALSIDLDSESLTIAGGTGLDTVGSGNTVTINIDSTVATLTGTQTLTNKTLTTPVISSISNTGTLTLPTSTDTLVGRATTDTLTNKTLTSPVINTGVSGTAFLDDDTFATASATTLASSESIKAYVDTTVAATNEVVEDTTPQLGGDLDTNGNDILFGDNDKAVFGAGSDLQIYHDGSHSYIKDVGTGTLYIAGDADIGFTNAAVNEWKIKASTNGAVELYYDGSTKLATTSTGIDVTGTATMDGLTVDASSAELQKNTGATFVIGTKDTAGLSASPIYTDLKFEGWNNRTNSLLRSWDESNSTGFGRLEVHTNDNASLKRRALFDYNGDISFYDDTGTSQALFWDASAERLGIGTTSPQTSLSIETSGTQDVVSPVVTGQTAGVTYGGLYTVRDGAGDQRGLDLKVYTANVGLNTAMRIDSSGNVGIGTDSPSVALDVNGDYQGAGNIITSSGFIRSPDGSAGTPSIQPGVDADTGFFRPTTNNIGFSTGGSEAMRIDASGNVGIGTDSPSNALDITRASGTKTAIRLLQTGYESWEVGIPAGNTALTFANSGTERMRLDSSGNLLVGTTNTDPTFNRVDGINISNQDAIFSRGGAAWDLGRNSTSGVHIAFYTDNGSARVSAGNISSDGSTTSYTTSSDARLKDVTGEARGLEVINELNPVAYNWKADGKADEGLIAQEVQEIVPNAVSGSEEEMYQMDYSKLVVHLVKAVKEQQAQIDALQSEINLLKGE